jgi:uncharacterized protein YjbJ (UPF0337 family)
METQNKTGETFKAAESFKITGNWETQSKELKTKFIQLTDADLKIEAGKEEEMLGRLQTRLSKNRDEVIDLINKNQLQKA